MKKRVEKRVPEGSKIWQEVSRRRKEKKRAGETLSDQ